MSSGARVTSPKVVHRGTLKDEEEEEGYAVYLCYNQDGPYYSPVDFGNGDF